MLDTSAISMPPLPYPASDDARGFCTELAIRWAYVLRRMGVHADPDDEPKVFNLRPDFGSGQGIASYYCGPYQPGAWPNSTIIAACALIAANQCRHVLLLGDLGSGNNPDITAIGPSQGTFAWCRTPIMATGGLRLAWIPAGKRRHVAALTTSMGVFARIGEPVGPDFAPDVSRDAEGVRKLFREAMRLRVGVTPLPRPPVSAEDSLPPWANMHLSPGASLPGNER